MHLADFDYTLPPELIAQTPIEPRDAARLLVLDRRTDTMAHYAVSDLPYLLRPGDLLVANRSRVLPARVHGVLRGGGRAELLLLRRLAAGRWEALCRPARRATRLPCTRRCALPPSMTYPQSPSRLRHTLSEVAAGTGPVAMVWQSSSTAAHGAIRTRSSPKVRLPPDTRR